MINRSLARLKVLQLAYANYVNDGKSLKAAKKELDTSLLTAYDLYHYLLLLVIEVTDYARHRGEVLQDRFIQDKQAVAMAQAVAGNRFAAKLEQNEQLQNFAENKKRHRWTEVESVVKKIYLDIIGSDLMREYMASPEKDYDADREFWARAYKQFVCCSEDVEEVLEDWNLYWNDDRHIIDTFVLKTIRRFAEDDSAVQELLPAYNEGDDTTFGEQLLALTLDGQDTYRRMVEERLTGQWDINRVAVMDLVIMICALAELLHFPTIPATVTISEYVNMAKDYSTPQSPQFVNAILDAILKELRQEGKTIK